MDFGCLLEGFLRGFRFYFASSSEACKWIIVFFHQFLLLKTHSGFAVKYKKMKILFVLRPVGQTLVRHAFWSSFLLIFGCLFGVPGTLLEQFV